MSLRSTHHPLRALFAGIWLIASTGAHTADAHDAPPTANREQAFLAENDAAMTKMMDGMTPKPTGDIDKDFVAMMTPHHQGAIDMAVAYLRYGQNDQLRRIAQEIVVEQQQEIAAMRLAIGQQLPPSAPAPTVPGTSPAPTAHASHATHHAHPTRQQED